MAEPKWTPGPWRVFIDDGGDETSGWPLSIGSVDDEDKSIVRPGGHYPYSWDAAMSQREAIANAHLIAAAPDLYEALWRFVGGEAEALGEDHDWIVQGRAALARARGESS